MVTSSKSRIEALSDGVFFIAIMELNVWGRLAACGGLVTRLPKCGRLPIGRRMPSGSF